MPCNISHVVPPAAGLYCYDCSSTLVECLRPDGTKSPCDQPHADDIIVCLDCGSQRDMAAFLPLARQAESSAGDDIS